MILENIKLLLESETEKENTDEKSYSVEDFVNLYPLHQNIIKFVLDNPDLEEEDIENLHTKFGVSKEEFDDELYELLSAFVKDRYGDGIDPDDISEELDDDEDEDFDED